MIFAVPRDGKTYVGTTDTFYEGDPKVMQISGSDRDYLLDAIHYMFPDLTLSETHIESSWAGVRPLVHEEGEKSFRDFKKRRDLGIRKRAYYYGRRKIYRVP